MQDKIADPSEEGETSWLNRVETRLEKYCKGPQVAGLLFGVAMAGLGWKYYDVSVVFFFLAALFFISFIGRRLGAGTPEAFEAIEPTPVPRTAIKKPLLEALKDGKEGVYLVVGKSGAGKSLLVKDTIADLKNLVRRLHEITLENYSDDDLGKLKGFVKDRDRGDDTLIVLDQLEKLFMQDPRSRRRTLRDLSEVFRKCRRRGRWRLVVVARHEWYLSLRAFGDLIPSLDTVTIVQGIRQSAEPEAWEDFTEALSKILGQDRELAERLRDDCLAAHTRDPFLIEDAPTWGQPGSADAAELIPVEAVAVAHALVVFSGRQGSEPSVLYHELGGIRGAMKAYFLAQLRRTGHAEDGARILAALSVSPHSHRSLTKRELAILTGVSQKRVGKILPSFLDSGLLKKAGEAEFDWSHDFFAEQFHDFSGSYLHPTERDNIGFFWEKLRTEGGTFSRVRVRDYSAPRAFSFALFTLSVFLLAGRTFSLPLAGSIPWLEPMFRVTSFTPEIVDFSFLPIAFSLTGWSWYVTRLFGRVLIRLEEKTPAKVFSLCIAAWSAVLVLLSVRWPLLWMVFTGLGGIAVGLKFMQIAFQMQGRFLAKETWFGKAGLLTVGNSLFTVIGGTVFAWFFQKGWQVVQFSAVDLAWAATVVGTLMLFFVWVASTQHITSDVAPIRVGAYRRYANTTLG